MANKPFAIQGADLTLGGVNLSAGTTGVVIPGVTQAANYVVEEVDENGSDESQDLGSNAGAITVIDNSRYLQLTGTAPSADYVAATYSVDELDDGNIEEITVETAGVFLAADKNRVEAANMWATLDATPFTSFTAGNWTQIPFRPKMRAGEVENIGGGGDSITNGDHSVSIDNNGVVTMSTSRGTVEFGALPEPGGTTHFHIMKGAGQDGSGGVDLYFGDDYNYVLQRADSYQGSEAYGVEIGANDRDGGDQHVWRFDPDGDLHIPPGKTIRDAMTGDDLLGGGTTALSSVWVQEFATSLGLDDVPLLASSVEYLANGDVVALFLHSVNSESSYYSGVARFDTHGTRVWSMKFEGAEGDIYINGWGLAVDNVGGYIYVAGQKSAETGYAVATLTKLSQADGDIVWSKQYDVGYANNNLVVDVASDGNPVVVGYADNGTDNQVVTTKIDSADGSVTWSKALNGQGDEEAYGMAVGSNGEMVSVGWMDQYGVQNAVATVVVEPVSNVKWTNERPVFNGGFSCTVSFPNGDGVPTFSNIEDTLGNRAIGDTLATILGSNLGDNGVDGVDDLVIKVGTIASDTDNRMLVVKYALSDGTIDWQAAVQVEAGFDCKGADADIDGGGNIYVCGNFDYDDGVSKSAMIIFKLDTVGIKQWSRKVVGDCEDFATTIVFGDDGYLYLSAVTGTNNNNDFSMVIAKYDTNGNVVWQRLLDNTTTWTFGGGLFFGINGASNLAVRNGYVAVSGAFGDPGTEPQAIVAQFDADGTTFAVGDYEFVAATFSGVLDNTASEITVTGAAKTDSDYIEEFTITNFSPTVDLTSDLIGTNYSSPLGTVGTVKLIAPGNRKIEEVYGYNSVEVTSRFFDSAVTTTAAFANSGNQNYVTVNVTATQLEELVALTNGNAFYYFEVSLDNDTYRKATYDGYNATLGSENFTFGLSGGVTLAVDAGTTVYYRIVTGADPVVWWNSANLPNGNNNFRGAVIDYHAYTGESTIIGTIHIVNDDGEEHITHTEVQSGTSDGENDYLWLVQNEGTVSYYRIDGESKTLKVQWTAKVFYGSEYYDD